MPPGSFRADPGGRILKRKKYSDALLALLLKSKHGLGQFTDKVEVDQTVNDVTKHRGYIHPDDLTPEQQREMADIDRQKWLQELGKEIVDAFNTAQSLESEE